MRQLNLRYSFWYMGGVSLSILGSPRISELTWIIFLGHHLFTLLLPLFGTST